jgi:hypothetical protein
MRARHHQAFDCPCRSSRQVHAFFMTGPIALMRRRFSLQSEFSRSPVDGPWQGCHRVGAFM